jgi:hypothetical protein
MTRLFSCLPLIPASAKKFLSNVYHLCRLSHDEGSLLAANKYIANSASGLTCTIIGSGVASSAQINNDIISLNDAFKNYSFSPSLLKYVVHLDTSRYQSDCDYGIDTLYEICPLSTSFLTTVYNYRCASRSLPRHFICHPQQIISQSDMPSIFNNIMSEDEYFFSRYNLSDFSATLLHPINVLGLALAWAIYLGYSTIFIDGCQCSWSAHHSTQDFIGQKTRFYANTNLLNQSHYERSISATRQRYPLRGSLDEWSSNFTLIDYSRHTLFYLYLLNRLSQARGAMIKNLSPLSYLQDVFCL